MRRLDASRVALLEQAYRAGANRLQAAKMAGCSWSAACGHFYKLARDGVVQAPRRPRPRQKLPGLPIYTGPDWIGKAIK